MYQIRITCAKIAFGGDIHYKGSEPFISSEEMARIKDKWPHLTFEVIRHVQHENRGTDNGVGRKATRKADARLQPDPEQSCATALGGKDGLRGKQAGGSDPDETVARVGKKVGRPRGRPRRNA